ncbi:hypothetical protein I5E68_12920 [Novosphingobium sp. YJ-S2-02]|uniref:Uncharacterized protein n=1 Tax=Novosphingobium aureum TaxID=2792964 RepID=A0A931HEC0_9SPHN|nr:hypothetical protein [Novosphingobium aureum]
MQERLVSGEWISWFGGPCPLPEGTMVLARLRYSGEVRAHAQDLRWRHDLYVDYGAEEVVAYCLLPGNLAETGT